MKRNYLYWSLQVAGWAAQAGLNLMFVLLFAPQTLGRGMLIYSLCAVSGLALSHQWRNFIRHKHWLELPLSSFAGRAFAGCLLLGAAQTLCAAIFYRLLLAPTTFTNLVWLPGALSIWILTFIL